MFHKRSKILGSIFCFSLTTEAKLIVIPLSSLCIYVPRTGNYHESLSDSKRATELQPAYLKAIVRGKHCRTLYDCVTSRPTDHGLGNTANLTAGRCLINTYNRHRNARLLFHYSVYPYGVIVRSSGVIVRVRDLLLVTHVSTTSAEVIFRVKWIVFD